MSTTHLVDVLYRYTAFLLMTTRYTEKVLVWQLRQGDKKAFQHLYISYRRALLGVITTIVGHSGEAEDLLQDTYVKVWQRFRYYDAEQGGLFNWMLNIARNTAIDAIRRRKSVQFISYAELEMSPAIVSYLLTSDAIGVEHLVKQVLLPQQWQIINLAYWHGYTYAEIADKLVLPLGTVKSRVRQSLIRLRPLFSCSKQGGVKQSLRRV